MFCSNCGRKLSAQDDRCPSCGGEGRSADYCTGFFGLTAPQRTEDALRPALDRANRRARTLTVVSIVLAAALALSLLFSAYLLLRPHREATPDPTPPAQTAQPAPTPTPKPSTEPTPSPEPSESPEPDASPDPDESPAPTETPAQDSPAPGGSAV